ncbi:MAG: aspartate-semialdehyde dehydrogenase [Clostridia bacterium]|nr:aspartate-semialdehyde dehydrogenase [Clostridia bacterium]
MKKNKLAIVGATGVVGRTVLKVLEERNLESFEYFLFSSKKSAGSKINFMKNDYTIMELSEDCFNENFDYAIFCAGGEISKKYAPIAAKTGCVVIDNSSHFRMVTDIPLIVPEVNSNDIAKHKGIIANPNCSTIQAIVAIAPLHKKYNVKRIVYSTYQAVSGAGIKGIDDLKNGINGNSILTKFPHPIFNNCLPHIDTFLENGYTKEEEKMINETRKILNAPHLNITATCVRVPVFNSHSESINIEFERDFELLDLIDTLKHSKNITIYDDPDNNLYPLAATATGHDNVFIGRIRRDYSVPSGINLWVVADNIRKGAATNAVQILEKLLAFN